MSEMQAEAPHSQRKGKNCDHLQKVWARVYKKELTLFIYRAIMSAKEIQEPPLTDIKGVDCRDIKGFGNR